MSAVALRARLRRRRLLVPAGRPGAGEPGPGWERRAARRPRLARAMVALLSGLIGGIVAGPVAGTAVAVYAQLAVAAFLRHRADRRRERASERALDAMATVAADLRAGAAVPVALGAARPAIAAEANVDPAETRHVERRIATALAVSDAAGAPLADLLDRLAADDWARTRVRRAAAAQAAGAAATAWLLVALPLAGVAVGYGMGADPLGILLHTRTGAVCALLALALQVAGLAWSRRLVAR